MHDNDVNRYFRELEVLNLSCRENSRETLDEIGQYTNLQTLDLSQSNVSDANLVRYHNLRRLKTLNLSKTNVGPGTYALLIHLIELESLHLGETRVDEQIIRVLGLRNSKLKYLDISHNGLARIDGIGILASLETLLLMGNPIDDRSIETIVAMPRLADVHLNGTNITESGLEKLRKLSTANVHKDI